MVLLDHGGRHPSEVRLIAPPPDLGWLAEHLWVQGSHGVVTGWRVVADASPHRIASVLRAAWTDNVPWSTVAYVAGYADQAHLTREVRALLGETPSAWRARGSAVSFKTPLRD